MSIGPSLTQEACLAVRVQRADLFNSLTQATYMELNLIRAVLPIFVDQKIFDFQLQAVTHCCISHATTSITML
jgi:hypothetical protein